MLLLALVDMANRNKRILRNAALKHALSGSLTVFMIGLVVFFMLANIPFQIGWVGLDSLLIITAYVVAVRLIHGNESKASQTNQMKRFRKEPPFYAPVNRVWFGRIVPDFYHSHHGTQCR
jgi:uncharacterized membrane protein